jgi:hypothetical protein
MNSAIWDKNVLIWEKFLNPNCEKGGITPESISCGGDGFFG